MEADIDIIVTGIAVGALKLALEEIKEIIKNRNKSKVRKRKSRK